MTNTATRPDRRPDWLQNKHAGPAPVTPESEWADQAIPKLVALIGTGPRQIPLPEGTSPDRARQLVRALYNAAYKGHNRRVPDAERISLAAHVADPRTGRCAKCDTMGCKPSPGRSTIHVLVNLKRDGRAHQASIPRDQWDYDPLAPSHASVPRTPARNRAACSSPTTAARSSPTRRHPQDAALPSRHTGTSPVRPGTRTPDRNNRSKRASLAGCAGRWDRPPENGRATTIASGASLQTERRQLPHSSAVNGNSA